MFKGSDNIMHDYENGHTCPTCKKINIPCTIEDGFCENEGDCNDCIKEKEWQRLMREEQDYDIDDDDYEEEELISECCFAYPVGELDMSTVPYGGASGFCGRCNDNAIFRSNWE